MNKLKINITYLYSTLFFLGYWNLSSYFNQFSIQITSYIDTLEIVFSFLKMTEYFSTILILIYFLILPFGVIALFSRRKKRNDENYEQESENLAKIRFFKNWKYIFKRKTPILKRIKSIALFPIYLINTKITYPPIIMAFIGYQLFISIKRKQNIYEYLGIVVVIEIIVIGFILLRLFKYIEKEKIDYFWFFTFILSFSATIYVNNLSYASYIKKVKGLQFVSFKYNKTQFETDERFRFIGSTQKYIFIFDSENEHTIIYNIADLNNIKFGKREFIPLKL